MLRRLQGFIESVLKHEIGDPICARYCGVIVGEILVILNVDKELGLLLAAISVFRAPMFPVSTKRSQAATWETIIVSMSPWLCAAVIVNIHASRYFVYAEELEGTSTEGPGFPPASPLRAHGVVVMPWS